MESGHYYQSKGPTAWAAVGWEILSRLKQDGDTSVLLVDDLHSIKDVNSAETHLEVVVFSPNTDFTIMESELLEPANRALELLKVLPKRSRARASNGSGSYFCSGVPVTKPDGSPTCLLYDLGFNIWKSERGLAIVNILPEFYVDEQQHLMRLTAKILPEVPISIILYDLSGRYRELHC
jgi:hypothetical protein